MSAEPAPAASDTGRAPVPTLRLMGRGTLSRQLVMRTTALVAFIAIALSSLTALTMQVMLTGQLDQELQGSLMRTRQIDPDRSGSTPPPEFGGGPGQQQGFLVYRLASGSGFVQQGNTRTLLSASAVEPFAKLPEGVATTVTLSGLGSYRVLASNGVVVGLPNGPNLQLIVGLVAAASALTALAILAAFLAARRVVEDSLRPLQRLAGTAHDVSQLELGSGEVDVPVRVPAADIDPRSEVGQVGLAFNHMLDNVEGALEARQRSETKVRQFVADASHELRNPLASIRGYAELTRRGRSDLPGDTQHALGRIESESERMSRLVEDLLLLARLDSGPALRREPVDLTTMVVNAVSDAQVAGPRHVWSVDLPADGAEVVVLGDPFRLHQVVANLLANARTHTPEGTSVVTSLAISGREATIAVSDDGPGIPAGVRDRVFERFTRADVARARSQAGTSSTGLGLAIVQAVVAAHGGTASVASTEGHGATFTVRLPLA